MVVIISPHFRRRNILFLGGSAEKLHVRKQTKIDEIGQNLFLSAERFWMKNIFEKKIMIDLSCLLLLYTCTGKPLNFPSIKEILTRVEGSFDQFRPFLSGTCGKFDCKPYKSK